MSCGFPRHKEKKKTDTTNHYNLTNLPSFGQIIGCNDSSLFSIYKLNNYNYNPYLANFPLTTVALSWREVCPDFVKMT